jgi:hypothetical protein
VATFDWLRKIFDIIFFFDRFFDFSSTFVLASGCDVRLRMEGLVFVDSKDVVFRVTGESERCGVFGELEFVESSKVDVETFTAEFHERQDRYIGVGDVEDITKSVFGVVEISHDNIATAESFDDFSAEAFNIFDLFEWDVIDKATFERLDIGIGSGIEHPRVWVDSRCPGDRMDGDVRDPRRIDRCIVIGSVVVRDKVTRVNILSPLTISPLLLVALVDGMSRILAITTGIIARVEVAVGAEVSLTTAIESTTMSAESSTRSSSESTTKSTTVESTETTTITATIASFAIAVTILAILRAEIRDVGVCDRCRILRGLVGENFDSGEEIRGRHGTKLVADRLMKGTPFFAERSEKSKVDFEIGH